MQCLLLKPYILPCRLRLSIEQVYHHSSFHERSIWKPKEAQTSELGSAEWELQDPRYLASNPDGRMLLANRVQQVKTC